MPTKSMSQQKKQRAYRRFYGSLTTLTEENERRTSSEVLYEKSSWKIISMLATKSVSVCSRRDRRRLFIIGAHLLHALFRHPTELFLPSHLQNHKRLPAKLPALEWKTNDSQETVVSPMPEYSEPKTRTWGESAAPFKQSKPSRCLVKTANHRTILRLNNTDQKLTPTTCTHHAKLIFHA